MLKTPPEFGPVSLQSQQNKTRSLRNIPERWCHVTFTFVYAQAMPGSASILFRYQTLSTLSLPFIYNQPSNTYVSPRSDPTSTAPWHYMPVADTVLPSD